MTYIDFIVKNLLRIIYAYRIKEWILLIKYHSFHYSKKVPLIIAVADGRRSSKGLTDRFKGMVSLYALAKATHSNFKILFTHPFNLTDYLIPKQYDWIPDDSELSDSVWDVRYRIIKKYPGVNKLYKELPINRQYRVYANYNYLENINKKFDKQFDFASLFHELFIPTKLLQDEIDHHLEKIGKKYISCTFRFQSLLGDFKEYHFRSAPKRKQKKLLEVCVQALKELIEKNNCPVVVTSDSTRFLSEIKGINQVYTIPGRVVHMDCTFGEKREVYLKSFVDFFMIAHAEKVYILGTKEMYPSHFPLYAATIYKKPFERIRIE